MPEQEQIRISDEFKDLIYDFKARCFANGKKAPTTVRITKIIAENIDKEKLFQNELAKL